MSAEAKPVSPEVINQVNQLMMSGFEIPAEKLVPTASLIADLGLDSLDAVDMLVYIEETMGIKVEGERLASVKTLADVYLLASESMPATSARPQASAAAAQAQTSQQL
jgi:acyl carrier protein